jgi:hypothetical protein
MAKGIGLIGNFKGKVGNTVGYKLTASNNGQTQGIRVYQPIVKNPKSAGQAEQRAKLLAVNATYRALKMVIDRGNEGLPYGNKSRLAWLKTALKAEGMPWFEKGSTPNFAVFCPISRGSLQSLTYQFNADGIQLNASGVTAETVVNTVGTLSTAIKAAYPNIQDGDQLTFVFVSGGDNNLAAEVISFEINTTSAESTETLFNDITPGVSEIMIGSRLNIGAVALIVSRQGANGEHLRSTESLKGDAASLASAPYDADSKAAAIASYRASAASNSDWAEESIQ